MRRAALLSFATLLLAARPSLAQQIPGIRPLDPGQIFRVAGMRGLLPESDGHYAPGPVDLNATRDGSALAFLVADPAIARDLAEARKFEAALKKLPHTHGFLVIPPGRSILPRQVIASLNAARLTLPTILDDHNIFTVSFRHERRDSPLYELFDRSQVLVIENASHLGQRLQNGETIGDLLRLLDDGKPVAPMVLEVPGAKRQPTSPKL
jgi:hypothetical protein